MSNAGYGQMQDVIMDEDFPGLDLALRRGRHIDRDDAAWYTLCLDAQAHLEAFYRRFGCELIHKADGYFYLLPNGDKLSRRQLAPGDMLVGQALALLYLDPAAIERGGVVTQEALVAQLSAVLGSDALIAAFNPKRKRFDERVAHKNVRNKVAEATRRLAGLGFVELVDAEQLRLRAALMRFAEPVRGLAEPAEALAKLAASGELVLAPEGSPDADGGEDDELDEDDGEAKSGVIAAGVVEPDADEMAASLDEVGATPDAVDLVAAVGDERLEHLVADAESAAAYGGEVASDDDDADAESVAADGGEILSDDDDADMPDADGGGALIPPDDYDDADDEGLG